MAKIPLKIDNDTLTPKFQQFIDCVINAINNKILRRGDVLPTVNEICEQTSLARGTVIKSFHELRKLGIIESIPRKGYYVATEFVDHIIKVFLLFDSFIPYKEELYHGFKEHLGKKAIEDIYFHHANINAFCSLTLDNLDRFGRYVIMPFDKASTTWMIKQVKHENLLILDRIDYIPEDFKNKCNYIGQDFEKDIYECLRESLPLVRKYKKIYLVFPSHENHPPGMIKGFKQFCKNHNLNHSVVHQININRIHQHELYIVIDDSDLVAIVEHCKNKNYHLGRDVGLISYNDTPLKRIIDVGITTISTDWRQMGISAAKHVLTGNKLQKINPTSLIIRGSL